MEKDADFNFLLKKIKESEEKQLEIIKKIEDLYNNLQTRVSIIESYGIEDLKKDVYKIDSKVSSFESEHDDRKEKWQMGLNFLVQLIWVAMAAWLLTKLGLQPPL